MEKEELEKKLKELKNVNTQMDNYIEIFNEVFETKIKLRDEQKTLLNVMAGDYLDQRYKLTDVYNFLSGQIDDLSENLIHTLNAEQKETFDKWDFVFNEMMIDMAQQSFVYGYIMAQQIQDESKDN